MLRLKSYTYYCLKGGFFFRCKSSVVGTLIFSEATPKPERSRFQREQKERKEMPTRGISVRKIFLTPEGSNSLSRFLPFLSHKHNNGNKEIASPASLSRPDSSLFVSPEPFMVESRSLVSFFRFELDSLCQKSRHNIKMRARFSLFAGSEMTA